jgi:hypothetical protein
MLKISPLKAASNTVTLRLEGRVVGPWVAELRNSCEQVLSEGRSLKLHLGGVEYLDGQGVALLSGLRSRGVSLLDCPLFAAEQLKGPGKT